MCTHCLSEIKQYKVIIILSLIHIFRRKLQLKRQMYNVCGAGSNKIFNVALREKRLPTPDVHNKYVSGKFTTKIYLIEQFFSNIHVFDKL